MRRRMLCLCLLALLTRSPHSWSTELGTIKGTVFDENRKPVAAAKVHISETKPFVGHRLLRFYETDAAGHFAIGSVPWGTYVVLAGKEDEGYPDTKFAFYSNLHVPRVTLAPATPAANVTVNLGRKAGIVLIEAVVNAVTGKSIDAASITLSRIDNPKFFLTKSTTVARILVPSLTPVAIKVTAPGHKPWPALGNARNHQQRVRLKPGEVYRLKANLQPEKTAEN